METLLNNWELIKTILLVLLLSVVIINYIVIYKQKALIKNYKFIINEKTTQIQSTNRINDNLKTQLNETAVNKVDVQDRFRKSSSNYKLLTSTLLNLIEKGIISAYYNNRMYTSFKYSRSGAIVTTTENKKKVLREAVIGINYNGNFISINEIIKQYREHIHAFEATKLDKVHSVKLTTVNSSGERDIEVV